MYMDKRLRDDEDNTEMMRTIQLPGSPTINKIYIVYLSMKEAQWRLITNVHLRYINI